MANRIKGITIEIGGDTTQLQKSLKQVDSALKSTESNLKDINKLLKLNPGNTELLSQKQENLNKAIEETEKRLQTLREAMKQLNEKNGYGATEEQRELAREIIDTENKLKSLKKEMEDFGSVTKQKLEAAGQAMKDVGDKMSDIGKDLSMKLTAPIVGLGTIGVNYNAQMEQLTVLFTTLTGSAEEADRVIKNIQADASKSPFDTESLIKANQYLISAGVNADDARQTILNLGNAIAATGGGANELDRMAANLQQIKNVGKASAQDIKQFANAGINIYGLLADATGKSVKQVQNMTISYDVLEKALAKASEEGGKYYGAMEAQSETMTGSINKLKSSLQMLLGEITKAAMPIIKRVISYVQNVINWFSALDDSQKEMILKIAAVVAAIGPALLILGQIISVLGSVVGAIGMLFSPMGLVITIIAAVIAAGVALYKNWDTIKQKLTAFKEKWKQDWQQIKNFFNDIWENMKNKLSNTLDTITNWLKQKIEFWKNLFKFNFEAPGFSFDDTSSYHYDQEYTKNYRPAMMMSAAGTTVNMVVNGGSVSANELADIVIDKLTTTIRRNGQRW